MCHQLSWWSWSPPCVTLGVTLGQSFELEPAEDGSTEVPACLLEAGALGRRGHPGPSERFSRMIVPALLVTPCLVRGLVSSLPDVPAGEPLAVLSTVRAEPFPLAFRGLGIHVV